MRIVFLTRSLEAAGAERQLATLALGLARRGHEVEVAVFYPGGPLTAELEAAGIPVHGLGKRGRWDVVGFALRAARRLRAARADVVHGYLIAPNLLAAALRPWLRGARVVWGVRASGLEFAHYDRLTRWSFELGRLLSRRADLIVANSRAGREHYVRRGYPAGRVVCIPNGIDTARFRPDSARGRAQRAGWGVADGETLIGIVARLDPMKDHETFLAAAARFAAAEPLARFVCVGGGAPWRREALERRARELGLEQRVVWNGECADMPAVYNALDLLTSCSAFGEGFSNAVGEALACGVACVVTDVGDAAAIVGEPGLVVPPRDPAALARAWREALGCDPGGRPAQLHERIVREFGVERLVEHTERALLGLVGR